MNVKIVTMQYTHTHTIVYAGSPLTIDQYEILSSNFHPLAIRL